MTVRMTRRFVHLGLVFSLLAGVGACAKAQARTPASSPPVDAPDAPPETAVPVPVNPVKLAPPEPATTPPVEPVTPVVKPAVSPPKPTTPPAVLRPANVVVLEKQARDLMALAERDLDKVDEDELSRAARDQFQAAKRFLRLAGEALEIKNYVYARQLADNAATLAAQLIKFAV